MNTDKTPNPIEIDETDLDTATGGLLPAIQKVRDAASVQATTPGTIKAGDGSVKPGQIKGYEGFPC